MSFEEKKIKYEGLTFDDVQLLPAYSEVLPREVDLRTRFTRNIKLNIPLASAAMDTVTEARLAIALAREGGIGVIHKNLSIETQVYQVKIVKRAQNAIIYEPEFLRNHDSLYHYQVKQRKTGYDSFPVLDSHDKVVGLVTGSSVMFRKDLNLAISKIMNNKPLMISIKEIVNGNGKIDLEKAVEKFLLSHKRKIIVVDEEKHLVGLITAKDVETLLDITTACIDLDGHLCVAAAISVGKDGLKRAEALVNAGVDALVIDTAHGHSQGVVETLKEVKQRYPHIDVVVGNIATADAARSLCEAGADAIKVGIGPGSICTTRVVAGVGVPQITAIYEVSKITSQFDVPLIADGGIRYSGDIPKAIAAGADCIMAGSLFAGVDESPGETIIFNGRKYKSYRGMGSVEAMEAGSKDRYFQDTEQDTKKLVPEGIAGRVAYKGSLSEVVHQLMGGLRAGMGYCGSKNILAQKQAMFVKTTVAGQVEAHPHDVTITSEAPNYSR